MTSPEIVCSQTAICGISGASYFSGFFCLLELVGLVARVRESVHSRTQHVFLQTGFGVGAYSIILNQLAIISTSHEIKPFSWLNLCDFHVSPCHLFPTKLDFAPFFSLFLPRAPDDKSLAICTSPKRTVLVPVRSLDFSAIPRCRLT